MPKVSSVFAVAAMLLISGCTLTRDGQLIPPSDPARVYYWYSDGSFTSEWSNARDSGKVTGRWRPHDNQRCIIITAGLPDRTGKENCGPLFRKGEKIISVNSDGSIHGIHTLSPTDLPSGTLK